MLHYKELSSSVKEEGVDKVNEQVRLSRIGIHDATSRIHSIKPQCHYSPHEINHYYPTS